MSLIPEFELGLWNAWIFEVLGLPIMILAYLIDKKALKRFRVMPPDGKTLRILALITQSIGIIPLVYSFFLPLKLGTVWFYVGLPIYFLSHVMNLGIINFVTSSPFEPVTKGVYRRYSLCFMDFSIIWNDISNIDKHCSWLRGTFLSC